ncbi:MAG: hypothetical protein QF926_06035 [Alphaproteobacteria bacterium]|nr:hypothetical protein [Alphaproteobacteria bacterium]MDP6516166.1 hypothetical protein [Alphaproteobacteria bacterium]
MKTAERRAATRRGALFAVVLVMFVGGLGLVVAVDWGGEAEEELSLSELLKNPFGDGNHSLTPLEEMRKRFRKEFQLERDKPPRPEIAATLLMLRAVTEFDESLQRAAINDAVRHMRQNPAIHDMIYKVIDSYATNNPHLATRVAEVKTAVQKGLAKEPGRALEWLKF